MSLCERFPGATPITFWHYRALDVIELIQRLNAYVERQSSGNTNKNRQVIERNGERVIRVHAGNDWF